MRLLIFCFLAFFHSLSNAYEWQQYPLEYSDFRFTEADLMTSWEQLHTADRALKPSIESVDAFLENLDIQEGVIPEPYATDRAFAVQTLKEGWIAYHQGDFQQAYDVGDKLGLLGLDLVVRAKGMHHTYLLQNEEDREEAFKELWEELKAKSSQWHVELPNLYLGLVFSAGRYAQEISIAKALSSGMASYVRDNTNAALKLDPTHPEGLAFKGAFNSEIIGKAGGFLGGLTYGVSKKKAKAEFAKVLELAPQDILIRLEVAQQYMHLGGQSNLLEAEKMIRDVLAVEPYDAVTALDRPRAASMLEEITKRLARMKKKKDVHRKGF